MYDTVLYIHKITWCIFVRDRRSKARGRANGVCLPRQGNDGQRSWSSAPKTSSSPVWVFPTPERCVGVYIARGAHARATDRRKELYGLCDDDDDILYEHTHTHTLQCVHYVYIYIYMCVYIKRYYINVWVCVGGWVDGCMCTFFSFTSFFLRADPSARAFAPPPPPLTKSIDRPTPTRSHYTYIHSWIEYTRVGILYFILTGLRLSLLLFYYVQLRRARIPPSIRVVVR